jgi:drug/metabolite transporter (DMT)-like permease
MVHLALVLTQFFFASLAVAGRFVLPVVPPGLLMMFRIFGAAAALLTLKLVRGGPWVRDPGDLRRLALAGLLGITVNQTLFLFGLAHTTAVNATIMVTTVPVFTVLGSLLLGLERPSPLKLTGIGLAGAGAIWLIGPDRLSLAPGVALGNLLILCGMICYSAYFLIAKPVLARHDTLTATTIVMLVAALGAVPVGLYSLARAHLGVVPPHIWWLVAYIVAFPTIVNYLLNFWALRRASSNTVAAFIYLQPVFAAVATPFLLPGETLTVRAAACGAVIFLGLGLVIRAEQGQARQIPVAPMPGE